MLLTGSDLIDAQRAFARALHARRRAALVRWLRREPAPCGRLPVYDERAAAGARPAHAVREIPLDAIRGTLEPGRARMFDDRFRPAASAGERWQRLWLAAHRGVELPPISVIAIDGAYVVRDGHHRVSVARARGAVAIDATVELSRRAPSARRAARHASPTAPAGGRARSRAAT